MQWLRYTWLFLGKLGALTFIFVGGGLLATTILPLLALFPGKKYDRAQSVIRMMFRFYIYGLQFLGMIRLNIKDAHKFNEFGGKMVVANHPSLLDVVMLMALIPNAQCVVKHELWNHFLLGGLVRRAGYIRNDLVIEELVAACKNSLDAGRCLIIFPEGTRTPPGELPKFHKGFAAVAILTKPLIQLVFITCTPPFLFKGEAWWHVPPQRPVFHVTMGECLDINALSSYGQPAITARSLVKSLEQHYAARTD